MKNKLALAGLMTGLVSGVFLSGVTQAAQPQQVEPSSQSYQRCAAWDGKACTVAGTTFLCYNLYPYEPGLCECLDNLTWSCM
ncbi:hypothetical protein JY651_03615 [Pyxidicoccus parkwayensis]|uniref:Uncharacterized protein n=1 Tax=Pyxidicoccus parkwayensis TaxID=2813578 RepID=A0ABX7P1V7_9BACT|nr:hypothetical protein [Pyxidicoccus parkwaysis]QSQ24079.1 hypothetical protein JY651_03615 [Pyxidicoccus parkwaysis]